MVEDFVFVGVSSYAGMARIPEQPIDSRAVRNFWNFVSRLWLVFILNSEQLGVDFASKPGG